MQNPRHLPKISWLRLALYKQTTFGKICIIMTSWRPTGSARTPTKTVITRLILHFTSIDHARKLLLNICGTKTACSNNVSSWNDGQRHCKCNRRSVGWWSNKNGEQRACVTCARLFPKAFVCTKRGGVEKFSGGAWGFAFSCHDFGKFRTEVQGFRFFYNHIGFSLVPIPYGGRPDGPSECENTLQNDDTSRYGYIHYWRVIIYHNIWKGFISTWQGTFSSSDITSKRQYTCFPSWSTRRICLSTYPTQFLWAEERALMTRT